MTTENVMALAFRNALGSTESAPVLGQNEPVHLSRSGLEWGSLLASMADVAAQFAAEFREMLRAVCDWPITDRLPPFAKLGATLEGIRMNQPTEGPKALIKVPTLAELKTGVIARFDQIYMDPNCTRKGAAEWRRLVHASGEKGALRIALMSEDTLRAHVATMSASQRDAAKALYKKAYDNFRKQWGNIVNQDPEFAKESKPRAVKSFAEQLASKPIDEVAKFIGNSGRTITPEFKRAINAYIKAMDTYAAAVMEAEALKD